MLVRRWPTVALLVCLPLVLAHCGSDTSDGGGAGSPSSAGKAGAVGTAGQPSLAGGGAGGSVVVAGGGGSTSLGGGGSSASLGGGGSTSAGAGGTSAGGSGGASGGSSGGSSAGAAGKAGSGSGGGSTGGFALTSPDHMEGAKFAKDYTCDAMNGTFGAGVNPELDWSGAPSGTMSFAITFIDTTLGDTNMLGQHWAIWNIPATVMKFPKATGMTLSGDLATAKQTGKFLTPCAQTVMNGTDDQYEFTVWAIPTATLAVTGASPTVAQVLTALKAISPKPPTATLHGHAGLKGK
jgi:phosphatidylethanolamine-binding protein (PEBP) family uncharacterized protein